ncbi:nuclear transport factor 2 family protein [Paenibacillus sp. FSL R7-0204]|uniref:nuclear transport factor 2 family protein n=1 Tax=Paenibacillus sp. FSL R7-0204 TaxID=2921675 RepID=UPI0030F54789
MINKIQFPRPVEEHFHATNTNDPATFLSIFAEDAIVFDAGKEYHGKTAIKEWSDHDYFGVGLRLEIKNVVENAKEIVVTAQSDGNYDKTGLPDPLYFDFHFTVDGDKITRLHNVLSSNSKAIPLPQPIAAYYHASDICDDDLLANCFAEDAILVDNGEEFHGPEVISKFIVKANRDAAGRTEVNNCVEKNDETVVTATISGNFKGSPIPLDFRFKLNNGKIKALNIVVSGV